VKDFVYEWSAGRSKPLNGGELAGIVKNDAETAANAIAEVETGENTGREADRASVPGRGVNIGSNALIEFDPLIRADADIHNDLLHLILTFLSDYGFA
jgi:hypothetical protein